MVGYRTVAEKSHHTLYTLVSPFLIMVLRALNCVEQPIPVIRNSFKCIVNPEERIAPKQTISISHIAFRSIHHEGVVLAVPLQFKFYYLKTVNIKEFLRIKF